MNPIRPANFRFALLLQAALGLLALLTQVGCSSGGPTTIQFEPSQYPAAFEAAKEAVRHYRFPLERVDYVAGEISTDQKFSSGIATPWDAEQSTFENEWEDYINQQCRSVRIRFAPASVAASGAPDQAGNQVAAAPGAAPVQDAAEPIVANVIVTVTRINRPGWHPQTKAVRLSSFSEDPELTERQIYSRYEVTVARDEKLAARIVARMQQTLKTAGKQPPAPHADAAPSTGE